MAASDYHFITHWRVESTLEEINDILGKNAPDLARWWPSVYLEVKIIEPGDPANHGLGEKVDLYTKGWLPYTLKWGFKIIESKYPNGFTLEAWGDFVGRGIWTFQQDGRFVNLTYDWKIHADKPLLRRFSWLFKPVFAANHEWAMRQGEISLKEELLRRHGQAGNLPRITFVPSQLAGYEARGWEAYYRHNWLKFFWLITRVGQQQFQFPLWRALQAGYFIARASAEWSKKANQPERVHKYVKRYYRLARRYSGLNFDPNLVAGLEEAYWDVHRRLIGQPDKTEFIEILTRLHSALFNITPDQARPSAEARVLANNTIDALIQQTSTDLPADWARLRNYLFECYSSIKEAVEKPREVSPVA
jgi:hypothetical protein